MVAYDRHFDSVAMGSLWSNVLQAQQGHQCAVHEELGE